MEQLFPSPSAPVRRVEKPAQASEVKVNKKRKRKIEKRKRKRKRKRKTMLLK